MSETSTPATGTKKTLATAVLAAVVGAAGGYAVSDQTASPGTPATEPINANVEMQAYTGAVTGVEAVGMVETGFAPHIHVKWNVNPTAKAYNVYVDGVKKNDNPIVIIGDTGRYTDMKDIKSGGTYKVSVAAVGLDGKEAPQSEAVTLTVK